MKQKILYLFTRTPLHVGAGASVGAIDQPIQRERHTGFPIIPATTLKGVFADGWTETVQKKVTRDGEEAEVPVIQRNIDGEWLFGSTDANNACAGALQFSEARLLVFPVRSAKGSFAWITSPLLLARAARDGVISEEAIPDFPADKSADDFAVFDQTGPLALGGKIVLEEYTFTNAPGDLKNLGESLKSIMSKDPVWKTLVNRLVVLSDGMMSFFAQNACEIAQHVKISDETGTAEGGALFNQENVPSETLFYAVFHCFDERSRTQRKEQLRMAAAATAAFSEKLKDQGHVFQFGGDASTGLGYCTVKLAEPRLVS